MDVMTYRVDLINGAMGSQRLTNKLLAEKTGLAIPTVSTIRNGHTNVTLPSLIAVADALGLSMQQLFEPKQEAKPHAA